ncbi:hypothetical protein V492_07960 [Pseudogymnoascus sp. VKM F-4246]|nr:hypothetical protein V492_07960 [Pseudogymnoascus sp. VKM F-4246]
MGSVVLPHLRTGWHVDQAIMNEDERLVVIRFGRDYSEDCMRQDEVLFKIADRVKNFAVVYVCDLEEVPDFKQMYELYDPMTIMFFFRNKHMMCDFGTGNNNKLNWVLEDKQELIDIIETIYRGAKKGRGLVLMMQRNTRRDKVMRGGDTVRVSGLYAERTHKKQLGEYGGDYKMAPKYRTAKPDGGTWQIQGWCETNCKAPQYILKIGRGTQQFSRNGHSLAFEAVIYVTYRKIILGNVRYVGQLPSNHHRQPTADSRHPSNRIFAQQIFLLQCLAILNHMGLAVHAIRIYHNRGTKVFSPTIPATIQMSIDPLMVALTLTQISTNHTASTPTAIRIPTSPSGTTPITKKMPTTYLTMTPALMGTRALDNALMYEPYESPYPVPPAQYAQQYRCSNQDFDDCGGGCCTEGMSSTGYYMPSYYDYLWPPVMVETVENVEEFTMKRDTRPMTGAKTRGSRDSGGRRRGREYYGSYGMGGCAMM